MVDWLITGAGGQFGSVLLAGLHRAGERAHGIISPAGPAPLAGACTRLDLADIEALRALVERLSARIIVHAGAITSIQAAFERPEQARRVNVDATQALVESAQNVGARIVFTSTDLVFDGTAAPYDEASPTSPLSVYARSKVSAEEVVLGYERGVVVRMALMYGLPAVDRPTTFLGQLEALRHGRPLKLFVDEFRTPISLDHAVAATRRVAESDVTGILHLAGPERLSRFDMGRIAAQAYGLPEANIIPTHQSDFSSPEPRPADVSMTCNRYASLFGVQPGRPMVEALRTQTESHHGPL